MEYKKLNIYRYIVDSRTSGVQTAQVYLYDDFFSIINPTVLHTLQLFESEYVEPQMQRMDYKL